jgi:hypothetical protein
LQWTKPIFGNWFFGLPETHQKKERFQLCFVDIHQCKEVGLLSGYNSDEGNGKKKAT